MDPLTEKKPLVRKAGVRTSGWTLERQATLTWMV